MPIVDLFYQMEAKSQIVYGEDPTGILSVEQLLQGQKKYWISPAIARERKPKKLILSDWTARTWSDEKIERVKKALTDLIDKGFTLYLEQSGQLKTLLKEELSCLDNPRIRHKMTPHYPSELHAAAMEQEHLTRDEIHVLDDYWLGVLISTEDTTPQERYLSASAFAALPLEDRAKQIAVLKSSEQPIQYILDDSFGVNHNTSELEIAFSNVEKRVQYYKALLSESNIKDLLNQHSCDDTDGSTLKLESLQDLKEVFFNSLSVHENIQLIFNQLTKVEDIGLINFNLNSKNLKQVLNATPSIKKIFLTSCKQDETDVESKLEPLNGLVKIDADNSRISIVTLQHLLNAAPNLKELDLSRGTVLSNSIEFEIVPLNCLDKINLLMVKIGLVNLKRLLNAAPNLKEINLLWYQTVEINSEFNLEPHQYLEKIDLQSSNIPLHNIQELLSATPNLKEINLSGCSELGAKSNFSLQLLHHLEKIDLSYSKISLNNLQQLLNASPNLKTIKLVRCDNLNPWPFTKVEFKLEPLNQLEKVDLTGLDLNDVSLKKLLEAAPNLKVMELVDARLTKELPQLEYLEIVDLSKSNATYDNLLFFLKTYPNLKKIVIDGCQNITESESQSLQKDYPFVILTNNVSKNTFNRDSKQAQKSIEIRIDPSHNANQFKNHKPTPEEMPFEFQGQNKTVNQGMIIEKWCQYLTLTNQNTHLISKVRDGVCNALAHFYCETTPQGWTDFIAKISAWDGKASAITNELTSYFNTLQTYVQTYQLNQAVYSPSQYLGDNLSAFLTSLKKDCILSNPWHSIAVKTLEAGERWMVYDPNYIKGAREVNKHQLLGVIKDSIGRLVSVESNQIMTPGIQNPASFIEEGGLLALMRCKNASQMLDRIRDHVNYSLLTLEGLLLRSVDGEPAWSKGVRHPNPQIVAFTNQLLELYSQKNQDYTQDLQQSMESMTAQKKQACISAIVEKDANSSAKNPALQESLVNIIRTPVASDYERALQTWKKQKTSTNTFLEYVQGCMQPGAIKKRLIELNSISEVDAIRFGLQKYGLDTQRPVFYIHSPEELVCKVPIVKREGNQGFLQKGPGGALYDFLQANNQGQAPILLVNYSEFHADDLVRLNALLDVERKIDDTEVPEDTLIIGLINIKKPDCYQGSDFYSRFDLVEQSPLTASQLEQQQVKLPLVEAKENNKKQVINLFHSPNWESLLLGHWVLDGHSLWFQEGALQKALEQGSTLEIQNGLWKDEGFGRFWQQACLQGFIEYAGLRITIPRDLQLIQSEGYDWETFKSWFTLVDKKPEKSTERVLNPYCLSEFLNSYVCDNQQQLHKQPGYVEAAKDKTLPVYLTRTLDEDEWAMLLSKCQNHKIELQVCCAPGVILPKALSVAHNPSILDNRREHTKIITSTDVDTTIAQLTTKEDNWQIIDISECNPSDLLESLEGGFNQESLHFEFKQTTGAVVRGLEQGKTVVLKGHFSEKLTDALAPLLLNRQLTENPSGQFIVVSDNPSSFQYMLTTSHQVTEDEKKAFLNQTASEKITPFLTKEPLSMLQARSEYWRDNPGCESSDGAWDGMAHLKKSIPPLAALNPKESIQEAYEFTQARLHAVNKILERAPYVFLAGLSGVGKSTFVANVLNKGSAFYEGKGAIKQWAEDLSNERKILFLDEANLSSGDWSLFEGLFTNPRGILLGNTFYPLSPNHKVVFAGNPVSYGDERKLATLFQRHGKALVFDPLPTSVLYEDILKPVFANTSLEQDASKLSGYFLDVYRFLVHCSTTDVLISPRELQMMALMTFSYHQNNPSSDLEEIAQYYAFMLAKNLVPKERYAVFEQQFHPTTRNFIEKTNTEDDFLITPSRYPIANQLDELLKLRLNKSRGTNDAQKYGGLGGIVLEGEAGIGKSELVIRTLVSNGYQEGKDFYRMPVSWSIVEKERLLRDAFDKGAVVIIDEINSSPMVENLLNHLLMGKTPEGERPKNPGFMIIGTQNPVTMAGRRAPSTALSRRLITEVLPNYSEQEMKDILVKKGIEEIKAKAMISAFINNIEYAKKNHLAPLPCFRDLLKLAKNDIKSSQAVMKPQQEVVQPKEKIQEEEFFRQLKTAIGEACDRYLKHHADRDDKRYNRNYEATFFSWVRHGQTGRINAENLNNTIQATTSLKEAIDEIDKLLTDESRRYETHSLASYVLDSVDGILPTGNHLLTDEKGHYSKVHWSFAREKISEYFGLDNVDRRQLM